MVAAKLRSVWVGAVVSFQLSVFSLSCGGSWVGGCEVAALCGLVSTERVELSVSFQFGWPS